MDNQTKDELLQHLKDLLADLFTQQRFGADGAGFARAHGYVDGYMRVLLDSGLVDKGELLQLVARQRERVAGPASTVVKPELPLPPGAQGRAA